jgi:hypothetical protein
MPNKLLKVGLLNAGSLGTNHDNFIAVCSQQDFDILAINETWLQTGEEGRAPVLPGYKLRHKPRPPGPRSRGGGVGFYIKRGVSARTVSHPVDPRHISVEQMWVTLSLNGRKLVIGTAYRPPWMDVDLFFNAISDTISYLHNYDHIMLLGDLNINVLAYDLKFTKLNNFLASFSLTQLVTKATHFTDSSQTLIDVVCTDVKAKRVDVVHLGPLYGHCLVSCEFYIKRNKPKPFTVSHRLIHKINPISFDRDLQSLRWDLIPKGNANDMVNLPSQNILLLFDLHAPIRTMVIKAPHPPWITDTIKLMMRLRDGAAADYHKTELASKKEYYKDMKSTVAKALYHEKVAYFKQNINNKINDPKLLWKNLKTTLLPKNDTELPASLNDPDLINKHFLSLPITSHASISQLTYFEFHRYSQSVFQLEPIKTNDIIKIMRGLKSNAEGCDGINLNMLIMTLPHTLDIITDLINTSILTSSFPDIWKVAIVRPLPKVANPSQLKDLRPISILPCLSKVVEKAVCMQVTEYLERNNILPDVQSGFRKGRGTVTALLDVTDNLLYAQDQGMCTLLVLLDFSRAFDCIDIKLLLSKLNYYGFDRRAVKWFNSYLTDRHQFVKMSLHDGSSCVSDKMELTRGVPQGSILGPILFILYCADIGLHISNSKFHIYADDIQVYISCKQSEVDSAIGKLNKDLASIAAWATSNGLLLNPSKTKYLIFGSNQQLTRLSPSVSVTMMGEPIERVSEARNLGLLMDDQLRYEKHILNSVRGCFYKLKVLYKIRPFLNETLRIQIVESLIMSKLNYMDTVYGPRLLSKTKQLVQRVQNACARFCFNIPLRAHVTPFMNKCNMLKMLHRRKLHLACLLFGVVNYQSPKYLFEKLLFRTTGRGARQCGLQLLTHRHASAAFRGSFRYAATKCWNNLPPPIRDLKSRYSFKINVKKHLFEHQKSQGNLKHDTSCF